MTISLLYSITTHLLASERCVCTRNVFTGIFGKFWVDAVLAVVQKFLEELAGPHRPGRRDKGQHFRLLSNQRRMRRFPNYRVTVGQSSVASESYEVCSNLA